MLRSTINKLRDLKFQYHIKKVSKYISIKNSHFFSQFRLSLVKPVEKIFVEIGDDCILDCKLVFETETGQIKIGDRVYIGNSTLICKSEIEFENDIFVAWGCYFYDHNSHSIDYRERQKDLKQQVQDYRAGLSFIENKNWSVVNTKPIKICSNAWIGMNSIILKGVTIGEGAIVGAGSVVTKDVPAWTVVAGNPAQVIRQIKQ